MSDYGYPIKCTLCYGIGECNLTVQPYCRIREGNTIRLMLVGQDPTIFKNQVRVKTVLMLDKENGQIFRWLKGIFGDRFEQVTVYATNIVKCMFKSPPSTRAEGGLRFLTPYFNNCKSHLIQEITTYQPTTIITLGEPAHKLFQTILDRSVVPKTMQKAFTGSFYRVSVRNIEFDYSPCLHIKTFRIAEVYGSSVQDFKRGLVKYFS